MIHVHGVDFEVEFAETKLSSPNMGETGWSTLKITLMQDMPEQRQQQVLWHELVHCLMDGEDDAEAIDEAFVRRLGNSLWALLNDNDLLDATWWQRVTAPPLPSDFEAIPLDSPRKARA